MTLLRKLEVFQYLQMNFRKSFYFLSQARQTQQTQLFFYLRDGFHDDSLIEILFQFHFNVKKVLGVALFEALSFLLLPIADFQNAYLEFDSDS